MKRKKAIKLLMCFALDRNSAELYLDIMHAFGLTNWQAVVNRSYEVYSGMYDTIHLLEI